MRGRQRVGEAAGERAYRIRPVRTAGQRTNEPGPPQSVRDAGVMVEASAVNGDLARHHRSSSSPTAGLRDRVLIRDTCRAAPPGLSGPWRAQARGRGILGSPPPRSRPARRRRSPGASSRTPGAAGFSWRDDRGHEDRRRSSSSAPRAASVNDRRARLPPNSIRTAGLLRDEGRHAELERELRDRPREATARRAPGECRRRIRSSSSDSAASGASAARNRARSHEDGRGDVISV